MIRIPFNKPSFTGRELSYIKDAVGRGSISGNGYYTRRCRELLERELAVPRVLLTTSCTDALEAAALLLDLGPGDEVIVPSFTFVSTVNAFVLRGARPVFAEVRPDTLNLDETRLEELITPRTKAVVLVHYAGVGCEMDRILEIAEGHAIAVVEDNAHGLYGRFRGRYLGTFGRFATQSFHETKNFHCGEGGALLVNDPGDVERAEIVVEKGTDRSRFFRGEVDKYTWVDLGSSYLPSDLVSAFLLAQLESREEIQAARRRIWERYDRELRPWAEGLGIRQPRVPAHCEHPYHLYYLLLASADQRRRLIVHLKARGILSVFHYVPLHTSRMGRSFGYRPGDLPVTEDASERLLRLPFFNTLTAGEQEQVVTAILAFEG